MAKWIPLKFDTRLWLFLSSGFALATVIGTLSHEFGHYLAARMMGYSAGINYYSTHLVEGQHMSHEEHFWFTLCGPLETLLTGCLGLAMLWYCKKSYQKAVRLSLGQWIGIFLSLFWLRPVSNYAWNIVNYIQKGHLSRRSDEFRLDRYLDLPSGTLSGITALLGMVVLVEVVLYYIPPPQRFTFLLSGLVGGLLGYFLWFDALGKVLMPQYISL